MRTAIIRPGSREAEALGWNITEPVEAVQPGAFLMTSDKPPYRTDLRAPFADGLYRFALSDESINLMERAFQRRLRTGDTQDLGIGGIYRSIAAGRALAINGAPNWAAVTALDPDAADFGSRQVKMVIRLALEGGGEGVVNDKPVKIGRHEAAALMRDHVDTAPLVDAWTLAFAIIGAHLFGRSPDAETGR